MQPRTLDQIIAELNPTYDPQIQSLRQRQSLIPNQLASDEQALGAKQQQAFGDILNGARRRGTGIAFGGIPLSEQARYTSTEYLPALARLRQSGQEQALSLEDAINGIYERRNNLAQQLRQNEVSQSEQQRQFNENLALQREQLAAQQRAAAANSFSPTLTRPGEGQQGSSIDQRTQSLYNSVRSMLDSGDKARILREFNAIATSAGYGNQDDKVKLQLLYKLNPNIFNGRSNALRLAGVQ